MRTRGIPLAEPNDDVIYTGDCHVLENGTSVYASVHIPQLPYCLGAVGSIEVISVEYPGVYCAHNSDQGA